MNSNFSMQVFIVVVDNFSNFWLFVLLFCFALQSGSVCWGTLNMFFWVDLIIGFCLNLSWPFVILLKIYVFARSTGLSFLFLCWNNPWGQGAFSNFCNFFLWNVWFLHYDISSSSAVELDFGMEDHSFYSL